MTQADVCNKPASGTAIKLTRKVGSQQIMRAAAAAVQHSSCGGARAADMLQKHCRISTGTCCRHKSATSSTIYCLKLQLFHQRSYQLPDQAHSGCWQRHSQTCMHACATGQMHPNTTRHNQLQACKSAAAHISCSRPVTRPVTPATLSQITPAALSRVTPAALSRA